MIAAYSPQARGRSERVFKMWQDLLPKELALAGIEDMATANRFLDEQFTPAQHRIQGCYHRVGKRLCVDHGYAY